MRGQEDRRPTRLRLARQLEEFLLIERVKSARWLVEDQQTRAVHERQQDSEFALVAGRVLAELEAEVEVQPFCDLLHPRLVDPTVQSAKVPDNVAAAEAPELGELASHVADQAFDLDRLPHTVESKNRGRTAGGVDESHKHADGRTLARAIGAEVAECFALRHLEVEVEQTSPTAVVLGQTLGADCCWHLRLSPSMGSQPNQKCSVCSSMREIEPGTMPRIRSNASVKAA